MASRQKQYELTLRLAAVMSKDYTATFDQAQQIVKDLRGELEQYAQKQDVWEMAAAGLAQSGLTELLSGLFDVYEQVISASMEYEYQMSAVAAISQATGDELAALDEKALELGKTTVFSASQSAQAMTYMAQAGWNDAEMLEGMSGVVNLAAASGTDLAEASSIAADTLAGFGMQASDAGRLADVLAQTAANANLNVSDLGETFKNSAAVAGALGFSVEDAAVGLGIMANAGIKGSRAGTTWRNIMNGLAQGITLTGEAIGQVDFSVFDENGEAKGWIESIRELRGYFADMTTQEKYTAAKDIAGERGYNGLLAIINATDEEFEALYNDIQNCTGAAEEMAKIRLDNLQGDVTLFQSAMESLKITAGRQLTPVLREVVQTGTGIVNWMGDVIEEHPGVVKALAAITVGLTAAAAALAAMAAVAKIKAIVSALGSLFGGPVGWISLAIGAAAAGISALVMAERDQENETQKLIDETEELIKAHEEMRGEFEKTVSGIDEGYRKTDDLIRMYEELSSKEKRSASEKAQLASIVEKLNSLMPELTLEYDEFSDSVNTSADAVRNLAMQQYLQKTQESRLDEIVTAQEQSRQYSEQAEKLEAQIAEAKEKEQKLEDEYQKAHRLTESTKTPLTWLAAWMAEGRAQSRVIPATNERIALEDELGALRIRQAQNSWEYQQLINEYANAAEDYFNTWGAGAGTDAEEAYSASAVGYEVDGDEMFGAYLGYEPEDAVTVNAAPAEVNIEITVEGNASEDTVEAIREGAREAADEFGERMDAYQRQQQRGAFR